MFYLSVQVRLLITFITLILTTITLIPMTIEYGIIGSAISITVSFLISFIIQLLFLTKFLKIKLLEIIIKWITPILASMLMVCFIYFLKSFFSYNLYNYFILIFCGGLLYSLCIYYCYKKNILFKNYLED